MAIGKQQEQRHGTQQGDLFGAENMAANDVNNRSMAGGVEPRKAGPTKRMQSDDEAELSNNEHVQSAQNNLSLVLKLVERDFKEQQPAFDVLRERILAGDFGDGVVPLSKQTSVPPVVAEMRALHGLKHEKAYDINMCRMVSDCIKNVRLVQGWRADGVVVDRPPSMVASNYKLGQNTEPNQEPNPGKETLTVAHIESRIATVRNKWPSMPTVTVVQTNADLPFSADAGVDGAYSDGEVFLVADMIADEKQLQKVLAHECIMHHSLEQMLGDYGFSKVHEAMQDLQKKNDPRIIALAKDIRSRYGNLPAEIQTKEMIALAGEQCLDEHGEIKVSFGFMKSVFAGVASWLRDQGIKVPFTTMELRGIMRDAGQWIRQDHGVQIDVSSISPSGLVLNSLTKQTEGVELTDGLRVADHMPNDRAGDTAIKDSGHDFVYQGRFIGKVLSVADGVVTQKIGRNDAQAQHALASLSAPVAVGEVVTIVYKNGTGIVTGQAVRQDLAR
jgi:hypothetical protein